MGENKQFKRALIGAACTLAFAAAGTAQAANWLMLQGTEDPGAAARANVWGFVQAQYQKDFSDPNATGQYVPPKLIGPNLDAQDGFNINRARIGVRGTGFPLDTRINYFVLLEMGNNGITHGNGAFARLTDASVTLNYIPGARVRAGLFKTPGSEEGLQAIHVFDYINFTEASNGLLLERLPNKAYTANLPAATEAQLQGGASLNGFNSPVGAFRDVGVQVFDAFDVGNDWEVSYAAMIGNGNGIEFSNSDGEYDKYLYLSAEKKYGGKGPKAEGLKFFAWGQWGERLLDNTPTGTDLKSYDRDRAGLGVKYMKKPFRVTAEYITADGMIWVGPDKPSFYFANPPSAIGANNGADAKASGWYVEGGWYIPNTKFELDARFDTMTRLEGRNDEHQFDKWTLGVQYHFNPKTRVTVNYEIRDFECTASTTPCANANKNLSGVGDKIGVQLTAIF
ncbi:MAG: OprO/OprP family phosphate-selective porin [Gammaproteobacteria bacterium]|nr:OprO/OprP family phosphate-selective porin [Gammaproteobacteria bacterium]